MKQFKVFLAATALSLCIIPTSYARLLNVVSYQELYEKSDLVVIATPLTKTADTDERTYFQGMVSIDRDGNRTSAAAIGVETTFGVSVVIKGDRATKQFVLHHYRETELAINGPNVVSFDPSDFRRPKDFILFLLKEQDGRYVPYGGQIDPGVQAITALGLSH